MSQKSCIAAALLELVPQPGAAHRGESAFQGRQHSESQEINRLSDKLILRHTQSFGQDFIPEQVRLLRDLKI